MLKKAIGLALALIMVTSVVGAFPAMAEKSDTDIAYPVEGGNIYFDPTTGTITDYNGNITNLTIPTEISGLPVKTIGENAFYNCDSIRTVIIPDSILEIKKHAFQNCYNIKGVKLPKSVTEIGGAAFGRCDSLERIDVDVDNEYYSSENGVLFDKSKQKLIRYPSGNKRTSYSIPNSVSELAGWAFEYSENLSSVTIPNSVEIIGGSRDFAEGGTFSWCHNLKKVIIGSKVEKIFFSSFDDCTNLTDVYYAGDESGRKNIDIQSSNIYLLDATWHYNVPFRTKEDKYSDETGGYVRDKETGEAKGEIEAQGGARPEAFYKNVVSKDSTIYGDYIIRDCVVEVKETKKLDVKGKIIVENGTLTVDGSASADAIEIKNGGRVRINGKLTTGNITASGKEGSGTLLSILGEVSAGDVELTEYAEAEISGRLSAENFTIKTKNARSRFYGEGQIWLKGDFAQKTSGALLWKSGENNFQPYKGFSVILEVNPKGHSINFDSPKTSYLYNLYTVKGKDDYSDNKWEGNAEIKGERYGVTKIRLKPWYKIIKSDVIDDEFFVRQALAEIQAAAEKDIKRVTFYNGVSEFGGKGSATNEALEKYLAAYLAGIEMGYSSEINIATEPWTEKLSVYYDGKYRDIELKFKYANVNGQIIANVNYSYRNSAPKLCYTFMTGNRSELVTAIKKYATSKYDSQMADYLNIPINQYVKDRGSKLIKLLWDGVKELQIKGWGLNIDGGKKYVKDFFKKGVDKYLETIEKKIGTAKTASLMEAGRRSAAIYEAEPESVPELKSETQNEAFSDEYFAWAMRDALGVDALDDETLASVTELDLSDSLITDISGIEKCVNLEKLNLEGNAIKSIEALRGLTNLESINLDGNSVSDVTPLENLTRLKELRLKSNFVSDAEALGGLEALETLDLSFNNIKDTDWAKRLTRLETLNITGNEISTLRGLGGAENLKTLWAGKNALSSLEGIEGLKLENLSIAQNAIEDISSINTAKLEFLDASENNISDISALSGAEALTELDLSENAAEDIAALSALKLRTLNLSGNDIQSIAALEGMESLKNLNCAHCGIEDFETVTTLTGLESLNVSGNEIWEMSFIAELTNLDELCASGCGLDSSDLEYVPEGIERLDVSANAIVELDALGRLYALSEINLADNYVYDTTELEKLAYLTKADVSGNLIENATAGGAELTNNIPKTSAAGIYFINEEISLAIGERAEQSVMTMPYGAETGEMNWQSSDESVAEVKDGVIEAKALGSAVITACDENGLEAEFTVNVVKSMIYNAEIFGGRVSATIENVTENDYGEVEAIIAVYENGSLISAKREKIAEFSPGYSMTVEMEAEKGQSAKIFLWKGTRPICEKSKAE